MALTTKQRAFVEAYLANGFNATRAAITAGYSARTARSIGAENLTKPDIAGLISKRLREMSMSADEALYRLSEQARGSIEDLLDAQQHLNLAEAAQRGKLHLVKELTVTSIAPGVEQVKVKLYDAQAALVHVLKEQHLRAGEPTERNEIVDTLSDDERAERIAALLERARARRDGRPPRTDPDQAPG